MDNFEKFSNYDKRSSYQQVRFGHDKPILETELNEIQQLQTDARLDIVSKHVYSGFTELVTKGFNGEPIVYNPSSNGLLLTNKIAIAPFTANIMGYTVHGSGNFTYNKIDNYILVDLGEVAKKAMYDSLVYLEVWFEIEKGEQSAKKFGYSMGDTIGTPAKDKRVGDETSRRLALCWNICVKNECDFDNYPEGLGYNDIFHYSHVFAKANGQLGNDSNVNISFSEATNDMFRAEKFHHDKNLYVAGRPTYEIDSSTLYGKYVYALPMFRIRRRNKVPYDITNFNGSSSYNKMVVNNDTSEKGDLLAGFRPDRLAYDMIDVNDVMDIRKSVCYADYNENSMADDTIRALFNNQLTTRQTKKMRRIQFGNKEIPFDKIDNATFSVPFNKSVKDKIPGGCTTENALVRYEDSICGMGAVFENSNYVLYDINKSSAELLNRDKGSIDFYFKPFWNGSDEDIDQEIMSLVDGGKHPIWKFEKKGLKLILTHYDTFSAVTVSGKSNLVQETKCEINLSQDLIKANQYYYIRISWTDKPMPLNGMAYVYINSIMKAQMEIPKCKLTAQYLKVGGVANSNKGFLISNLIGYKKNFELLMMEGSKYGYAKNKFWPMLPKDFMYSDTLLMPGFNGIVNNYGDDSFTQVQMTLELAPYSTTAGKRFKFEVSSDKKIVSIDKVYNYENDKLYIYQTNYDVIIDDVATNNQAGEIIHYGSVAEVVFQNTYAAVKKIVIEATIQLSTGCGGQDIATEVLGATMMKYDDEDDNYYYPLRMTEEVSFNAKGAYPRQIPWLKPRKVNGEEDKAYDVSNQLRSQYQCYARLIYYNVSGNGTAEYKIPINVYGYNVIGVIGCSSIGKIKNVYRTPSEIPDEPENEITVMLETPLLVGETITFELATSGFSFDYELNSKTLMTDMYQCKNLVFLTDGKNSKFTKPCMSNSDEYLHGGILKSVMTFIDSDGNKHFQCYEDSMIFYNEYGEVIENKKRLNAREIKVSGFGTPFITVDLGKIYPMGTRIEVPIMTTYQPLKSDILSVWYNYIPYQGNMTNARQTVKRITDWHYFITTLGTGKNDKDVIYRNVVNNLPGGLTYGYKMDNKDIVVKYAKNNMTNTLSNINKQLVFLNNFMLEYNKDFSNLASEYKVKKNCACFQDGELKFLNVDFSLYFDDLVNPINKYVGAYCVVVTDTGELMVMVIGNFDETATAINHLHPTYGDLYRIKGRPTTVRNSD